MNKTDMLRTITLTVATLLSISLAPVAIAGHKHDRDDDSVIVSHRFEREHTFRSDRHEHQHRPLRPPHEHHHDYREKIWRNQLRPVIWQRSFYQPRLVIRLPWLILVDY